MKRTAIIDYGVGNLFSLMSSLKYLGEDCVVTRSAPDIEDADRVILPGVGAFGDAMDKLSSTGLVPVLDEQVRKGKPLMGICLGMQMLFEKSHEYGEHAGLGYIGGTVEPLEDDLAAAGQELKVPHMGWNALEITRPDAPVLKYTKNGEYMYFVHSYYAKNCADSLAACAEYAVMVPAVVWRDNVFGCQFHPEKSSAAGLRILRAFAEM